MPAKRNSCMNLEKVDRARRTLTCAFSVQSEVHSDFVFRGGSGAVDLVAEDENGHIGDLLILHQGVQLSFGLGKAFSIPRIHEKHDAVHSREIILKEGLKPFRVIPSNYGIMSDKRPMTAPACRSKITPHTLASLQCVHTLKPFLHRSF